MAKNYTNIQRTDQNFPTQFTENQNTQAQITQSQKTQSQKTQSLIIPKAKKQQEQNTQGQDT